MNLFQIFQEWQKGCSNTKTIEKVSSIGEGTRYKTFVTHRETNNPGECEACTEAALRAAERHIRQQATLEAITETLNALRGLRARLARGQSIDEALARTIDDLDGRWKGLSQAISRRT